jgi:hypothetical protein
MNPPTPEDAFWIVDDSANCQRQVEYTDVRLLA